MIDVIGKWIILAMQGNCLVEITHLPEKMYYCSRYLSGTKTQIYDTANQSGFL